MEVGFKSKVNQMMTAGFKSKETMTNNDFCPALLIYLRLRFRKANKPIFY